MQNQIKSALLMNDNYYDVTVFGYSNHGIPGVEIVGLGTDGRIIKEKIIYLIRAKALGVPKKRIVIGVDIDGEINKKISYEPLELPIFITFLTLSGHLKTNALNNCFSIGGLSTLGKYNSRFFNKSLSNFLDRKVQDEEKLCLIAPSNFYANSCNFKIDIDEFLSNIQKIDSPVNSLGFSSPINLSTVGATSFNANFDSIS